MANTYRYEKCVRMRVCLMQAPELIDGYGYGKEVDIWSVGILVRQCDTTCGVLPSSYR